MSFENMIFNKCLMFVFVDQLIISKVFLGRSATVKEGVPIDCKYYPRANSVFLSTNSKQHTALTAPGEFECVYTLPKIIQNSCKQSNNACVYLCLCACIRL